ncbi:PaaI family thioesterase [Chachezhania sediminis]|uniref:PaaI family thioesterase n=1 Tax=Chachezhania sediminis TaxID=2599291 RepID=UPI00131B02C0|nr:PaaI family thioesterase [Chachezhania sediminis]
MRDDIDHQDLEARGWIRNETHAAFSSHVGPVWRKADGDRHRFGFRVGPHHDNSQGRAHGGMIMTFCDDALGSTAMLARPGRVLFTVSFDCQFISGAETGEFVEAVTEVVRATGSLMFMRGECRVGDRVVATCNGIWKVLGERGIRA